MIANFKDSAQYNKEINLHAQTDEVKEQEAIQSYKQLAKVSNHNITTYQYKFISTAIVKKKLNHINYKIHQITNIKHD